MKARAHPGNAVAAPVGLDSGVVSADLLGPPNSWNGSHHAIRWQRCQQI